MKVEEDPASPHYIQTVRGYGYRFAGPEELS
jgi:DNA-binding response OmpR family regulator